MQRLKRSTSHILSKSSYRSRSAENQRDELPGMDVPDGRASWSRAASQFCELKRVTDLDMDASPRIVVSKDSTTCNNVRLTRSKSLNEERPVQYCSLTPSTSNQALREPNYSDRSINQSIINNQSIISSFDAKHTGHSHKFERPSSTKSSRAGRHPFEEASIGHTYCSQSVPTRTSKFLRNPIVATATARRLSLLFRGRAGKRPSIETGNRNQSPVSIETGSVLKIDRNAHRVILEDDDIANKLNHQANFENSSSENKRQICANISTPNERTNMKRSNRTTESDNEFYSPSPTRIEPTFQFDENNSPDIGLSTNDTRPNSVENTTAVDNTLETNKPNISDISTTTLAEPAESSASQQQATTTTTSNQNNNGPQTRNVPRRRGSFLDGIGSLLTRGRKAKWVINPPDPSFQVTYLGNVVTTLARGPEAYEKPLALIWKTYCSKSRPDIRMRLVVTRSGMKAHTRAQGITEYWAHRITYSNYPGATSSRYSKIFVWVYKHEGKRMKPELRCHAALCKKSDVPKQLDSLLRNTVTTALREYKRDKIVRQNARLSGGIIPRRRMLLSRSAASNYRPTLMHSKSAPKLYSIEEETEQEHHHHHQHHHQQHRNRLLNRPRRSATMSQDNDRLTRELIAPRIVEECPSSDSDVSDDDDDDDDIPPDEEEEDDDDAASVITTERIQINRRYKNDDTNEYVSTSPYPRHSVARLLQPDDPRSLSASHSRFSSISSIFTLTGSTNNVNISQHQHLQQLAAMTSVQSHLNAIRADLLHYYGNDGRWISESTDELSSEGVGSSPSGARHLNDSFDDDDDDDGGGDEDAINSDDTFDGGSQNLLAVPGFSRLDKPRNKVPPHVSSYPTSGSRFIESPFGDIRPGRPAPKGLSERAKLANARLATAVEAQDEMSSHQSNVTEQFVDTNKFKKEAKNVDKAQITPLTEEFGGNKLFVGRFSDTEVDISPGRRQHDSEEISEVDTKFENFRQSGGFDNISEMSRIKNVNAGGGPTYLSNGHVTTGYVENHAVEILGPNNIFNPDKNCSDNKNNNKCTKNKSNYNNDTKNSIPSDMFVNNRLEIATTLAVSNESYFKIDSVHESTNDLNSETVSHVSENVTKPTETAGVVSNELYFKIPAAHEFKNFGEYEKLEISQEYDRKNSSDQEERWRTPSVASSSTVTSELHVGSQLWQADRVMRELKIDYPDEDTKMDYADVSYDVKHETKNDVISKMRLRGPSKSVKNSVSAPPGVPVGKAVSSATAKMFSIARLVTELEPSSSLPMNTGKIDNHKPDKCNSVTRSSNKYDVPDILTTNKRQVTNEFRHNLHGNTIEIKRNYNNSNNNKDSIPLSHSVSIHGYPNDKLSSVPIRTPSHFDSRYESWLDDPDETISEESGYVDSEKLQIGESSDGAEAITATKATTHATTNTNNGESVPTSPTILATTLRNTPYRNHSDDSLRDMSYISNEPKIGSFELRHTEHTNAPPAMAQTSYNTGFKPRHNILVDNKAEDMKTTNKCEPCINNSEHTYDETDRRNLNRQSSDRTSQKHVLVISRF